MGRKGKAQKHTAKEIAGKVKKAKEKLGAAGGGGSGAAERKAASLKASVVCEMCKLTQPSLKTMKIHFESKHTKDPFPEQKYAKMFQDAKDAANAEKSKWK